MIRFIDIILSSFLVLVAAIPMLGIALFILMEDGGAVIFRQTRVGLHGNPFTMFKFRSMKDTNSQEHHGEVINSDYQDKLQARIKFKTTMVDDPRITSVGRFIRKTHLDELPQLFNVLRGDMSLVGVRPDTPAQEVDYDKDYWLLRHIYKPGITGYAQVMNNTKGGMEGRKYWEMIWIEKRSLVTYFSIIWKTCLKVLKGNSF